MNIEAKRKGASYDAMLNLYAMSLITIDIRIT